MGEFIIRPSSRGPEFLGISLVIHSSSAAGGSVIQHMQVSEGPKTGSGPGWRLALGKWLQVMEIHALPPKEKYDDLDEMIVRFLEPLVANIKSLTSNRKFRDGARPGVDAWVKAEHQRTRSAAYAIGINLEKPGIFYMAFIYNVSLHHDAIYCTNQGYCFRGKTFEEVEMLINYFKANPVNTARLAAAPMVRWVWREGRAGWGCR